MAVKILQINKFLGPAGGAESYMFELSRELISQGYSIEYWGMKHSNNIIEDKYDCFADEIDYHNLSLNDKLARTASTIYSFANQKKIAKILDEFQPDIVHIHNYNFQLTPSILPEIKKRGIKIVQTVHDSQMVCPYHRLYNFQRDTTCTKCVEGSFFNCIKDRCFDGSLLRSIVGAAESMLYHRLGYYNKYIDIYISPSKFLASLIKKRIKKEVLVIPNFFELPPEYSDAPVKGDKDDYILYYGRVSREKGITRIQHLIENLKIKLYIVGRGDDEDNIKESQFINYLGPKYGNELFELIRNAKAVIQPAIWYENCPMTVIESFAFGTPVIASDHSGFKELIKEDYNGYRINFYNSDTLDNLKQVLSQINSEEMAENCFNTYQKRYRSEQHFNQILALYNSLLE